MNGLSADNERAVCTSKQHRHTAYTQSEQNEFFTVCLVRKEEYLLLSSHTNWKVLTELTGETDSTNCQP